MLEARGDNKSPVENQNAVEFSSPDAIESKLLTTISQIDPKRLEAISHDKYISSLTRTLVSSLDQDYSQLLLFIQAIKDCGRPCYKRDVLVETLHEVFIVQRERVLLKLICDISTNHSDFVPWKEIANTLATMPDLVANCGLINRFSEFIPRRFYQMLLITIYCSLSTRVNEKKSSIMREEIYLFYAHLIGRIAIAGFGTLVWNNFTSQLVAEQDTLLQSLGSKILCIPITVAEFEIFIEPLYGPIFYHMSATPTNGRLIQSIIGTSLLHNETLQHIACKKYILQTNFNHERHRQKLILYNIFSYLSRLMNNNNSNRPPTEAAANLTSVETTNEADGCRRVGGELDTEGQEESSILVDTLMEVARSWSNSTKILLRPYEHNRYVGCALVMALKFALEKEHKRCLLRKANEIQSEVIRGLQVYLNRSSSELRNVAMCVAEIALTRLHDLIDAELGKDPGKKVPLKLDIVWDESSLAIKRMFELDIDTFCRELDSSIISRDEDDGGGNSEANHQKIDRQQNQSRHQSTAVVEAASDGASADFDDEDDDDYDDHSMDAPIYLNDCMNGLIDSDKPRYVKICLTKVGELIRQLSKQHQENDDNKSVAKVKNTNNSILKKSTTNDAIRDVAIELAQVLLHLEDQYSLDNFDALQRSALVSLTVAAPDLVAKYLLDELNEQSKNIRLQTIILQTLIESAQQLGNRFTKYGALYFYGMVHQLKISTLAPSLSLLSLSRSSASAPSTAEAEAISIVSAVKSMKAADQLVASDDSYLLSRVLLSVSLIIKCLNQQLITCKLSNDLLDILAAYRHHPDSGVRKAIVSCLTVIRDCTPTVYFRENLNDKTAQLFSAWLAIESEFTREDK